MRGKEIEGREISLDFSGGKPAVSNDRNGGGQRSFGGAPGAGGPSTTLFVGNLSFKTQENNLRRFFADCGEVKDIRVAKD